MAENVYQPLVWVFIHLTFFSFFFQVSFSTSAHVKSTDCTVRDFRDAANLSNGWKLKSGEVTDTVWLINNSTRPLTQWITGHANHVSESAMFRPQTIFRP